MRKKLSLQIQNVSSAYIYWNRKKEIKYANVFGDILSWKYNQTKLILQSFLFNVLEKPRI